MGDLAGDDGGLARARAREHERHILVRGDRRRLLVRGRGGDHARRRLDDGGFAGGDMAGVRVFSGRLEGIAVGDRLDAGERLRSANRQM